MSFANIYREIKEFYSSCHKFTFWFCIIELNRILGFTPSVPSIVLYAALIGYAVYQLLRQNMTFDWFLTAFLIYVPLSLLVISPDAIFHSWERFVLFALLVLCVSPIFTSKQSIKSLAFGLWQQPYSQKQGGACFISKCFMNIVHYVSH